MTIFFSNIRRIFGRKINLVFMLVIPILLNVFTVNAFSGDVEYKVGIRDYDQSRFTKNLADKLGDTCTIVKIEKKDNSKQMVLDNDIDIAVKFDKGFAEDMMNGKDVRAEYSVLNDTNASEPGQMFLKSCIAAGKEIGKASGGDKTVFYDGMKEYYNQDYKVQYKKFKTSISEKVDLAQQSLGYVAYGMIFLMTFATMMILEDKLSGVYDRVCVTPLRSSSYYVQNLLSFFVVALIQIIAVLFILTEFVGLSYGKTVLDVVKTGVVCMAFAMLCIAVGIVASHFAKTTLMATSITMFVNIPMLMLGGCFWPRSIMPESVQRIGDFMPTTWFLYAAKEVMYGKGIRAVWQYVGGLILLSAVLLAVAFLAKTEKAK